MKFLPVLFCLLAFTSCHHVYYAPNTPNVTQFTEKNELRANLGFISGSNSSFSGGDLQLGYAPANHLGLMLNGFTAAETGMMGERREKGSGTYGEAGIGYWTTFDKKKEWTAEVYAGLGSGTVNSDYDQNEFSKVAVSKVFLQPAVGYKWKYIEFAFAPRLARVSWKVKGLRTTEASVETDMEYIRQNRNFFEFEPGLILRGGSQKVKVQFGLTFTSDPEYFGYESPKETMVGYFGVSFNLSAKKTAPAVPANSP